MTLNDSIAGVLEKNIAEALSDHRLKALLSGRMPAPQVKALFQNFIVTHLNSIQILSFLFSLAPPPASDLVAENLLEEMGVEQGERPHPELLLDLARGLGFTERETDRLVVQAQEERRKFLSSALPYSTLRELGFAVLLETLAFEAFLSRSSDRIAKSLCEHYGLSVAEVRWFTLHGEVDVRHAEEGKRVVQSYVSHYRFSESEVASVLRNTFARNVILDRYFPQATAATRSLRPSGIESVEVLPLRIPFNHSFRHAQIDRAVSDSVVVRVTGIDGSRGYGEGLPRPYVTGEDVATMVDTLRSRLVPEILRREFGPDMLILDQIKSLMQQGTIWEGTPEDSTRWNATMCAVELALLDWAFGRAGKSLSAWLVPARDRLAYTGIIDAASPETAGRLAARYADAGFSKLKVKVGIGRDAPRLEAVKQNVGSRVSIRVDANGAWDAATAIKELASLRDFRIEAVEQPVQAADLQGMRQVREEIGIPVVADESLLTLEDARRLVQQQACDVFNIRVSKCGGLIPSQAIAQFALENGMKVQVGAQVGETSLLSAAGRHLAASLPEVEYIEGSFGTYLLSEDISSDPVMFGHQGRGELLVGPGLGVVVDDGALERHATEIVRLCR